MVALSSKASYESEAKIEIYYQDFDGDLDADLDDVHLLPDYLAGNAAEICNALLYSYEAYTTINPKYGMKVENYGIYHYSAYTETYLGSLHNLEGSIGFNIVSREMYSGLTCFYGTYEHTLTWEDLAKVYMTGKELEIDPWMNCICMK